MTTERPILFSAPMVRALLAGTKTQTRRALRAQPPANTVQVSPWHHPDERPHFYAWERDGEPEPSAVFGGAQISEWPALPCPYGKPGDRLWVREAWGFNPDHASQIGHICYRADRGHEHDGIRWRPSIHMPRAASRILLEVTEVRVERLQDISEADAQAEGIPYSERFGGYCIGQAEHFNSHDPRQSYFSLWEAINGPGSVEANPWVWVVAFKVAKA